MIFKKLISTLAFAIAACVCSVSAYAIPTTTYYDFSASGSVVNPTLTPTSTNYSFSFLLSSTDGTSLNFVSGTYDGSAVTSNSPNNIGTMSGGILSTLAPLGIDSGFSGLVNGVDIGKTIRSSSITITEYYSDTASNRTGSNNSYIFQVSGAPEIDGSLAPKVGFLLGCLFLMFGRKKQNTEPMMTA